MDVAELSRLLDLPPDPTEVDVRAARRRAAKTLHPDTHGVARERAMAEVNEACDRLISAIRSGDTRRSDHGRRTARPRRGEPDEHRADPPRTPRPRRAPPMFNRVYAALTVLWLMAASVLSFAIVGDIAVAMLVGAAAAAMMLALLRYVIPAPTAT